MHLLHMHRIGARLVLIIILLTFYYFTFSKVELGLGDDIPPPVIYPTPYGGKLDFVLPYGNLMIVHLKDKSKIR